MPGGRWCDPEVHCICHRDQGPGYRLIILSALHHLAQHVQRTRVAKTAPSALGKGLTQAPGAGKAEGELTVWDRN